MSPSAIPKVVPPLPRGNPYGRALPWRTAFSWLRRGWRDLAANPGPSLAYGLLVFLLSLAAVWSLFALGIDFILLPVLSGFLVLGPLIASGLYEKSRRFERGERTSLAGMVLVRPASGHQAFFLGLLLLSLMLLWWRAAVLLYALFFGVLPFPGFGEAEAMLFTTWTGLSLLVTGSLVGALFAALAFAVSLLGVPMMLEERTDALTAMGLSVALVWNNLGVTLAWGAIVVMLVLLSILTAFAGLIVAFPVLGHGTWHAYRALRGETRGERVFFRPA